MAAEFPKLSNQSREVLSTAEREVRRFNHSHIGTEHVLLALVQVTDGLAVRVLGSMNVEPDDVRAAIEPTIVRGERPFLDDFHLTPHVKEMVEFAVDEARRSGCFLIGTEHLLMGITRGDGVAAGVLESLGVSLDMVRAEAKRLSE